MLTPAELAQRLDQRFRVLTGSERGAVERHQTLRAAIDWSYDLLTEPERRVLERLSVFAGGFTLAAAEAVAAGPDVDTFDVFELLAALVARSLVVADSEGTGTRYRLLETIRQYAQERLDASGDTARTRGAHARYYAGFVETVAPGFVGPDELDWLARLVRESDNLRVALAWTAEAGDADSALRILSLERSHVLVASEIGQLFYAAAEPVLAIPGIDAHPQYPIALVCAAMRCSSLADYEQAARYCDEAEAAERRLQVPPSTEVWGARSWVALGQARTDEHQEAAARMVELSRANGDHVMLAVALGQRAMSRSLRGEDLDEAITEVDEALEIARRLGAPSLLVSALAFSTFVVADVHPDRARVLMEEAVRIKELRSVRAPLYSIAGDVAERLGDRRLGLEYFTLGMDEMSWIGSSEMVGRMLQRIGLLIADDEPENGALITGAARRRSVGYTMTTRVVDRWERVMADLDAALGEQARHELQARGAAIDDREATRSRVRPPPVCSTCGRGRARRSPRVSPAPTRPNTICAHGRLPRGARRRVLRIG